MRKLVWFTLGFSAACAIGTYFAPGLWALLLAALPLLVCGGLSFLRYRHKAFRAGMLICLGLAVGFSWFCTYDGIYLHTARLADGSTRQITLHVTDYPLETDYGLSVDGKIELEDKAYTCRLYLTDPEVLPTPGQRITVSAELQLTTHGGQNEPTHHRGSGIFLLAYSRDNAIVAPGQETFRTKTAMLRNQAGNLLQEIFPADTTGFARALLLGDQSGLDYTQRNAMSLTGISHVAAVSGMHLSIAFALVHLITMRRRFLSALVGIPAAFLFAAVAGFSPSVSRAALMLTLSLLARLLGRDYDPPTALAFGAFVLLSLNPTAIASVSFQLSVGAVAGIFCFSAPLARWMKGKLPEKKRWSRFAGKLASAISVTLGATAFTAPLGAVHFGVISLVAPITNLLTLWAVSLAFYGILGTVVMAWISLPLGQALAWLVSWPLRYVLGVSHVLSRFPLAAVYPSSNSYVVYWVIFASILLTVFLLGKAKSKAIFSLSLAFTLLLAVLLPCLEPLTAAARVTVLDVGQGQSIILQYRGRTFLVDCGGSAGEGAGETAAQALLTQGITRIDGVILTHYDSDHTSGLAHFLTRIQAEALYLPPTWDEPEHTRLGRLVRRFYDITEDLTLTWADGILRIFSPAATGDSNDCSLAVLFSVGAWDALMTGDMSIRGEEMLLRSHNLPDVELLVAGHHGSKHSTGELLLSTLQPELLAISVGKNSYGHPAREVLERAETWGCIIHRTDREGTLVFRSPP